MTAKTVEYGNSIYDNCGEYGGFQKHKRYHTIPCKPCVDARNKYMRDYRHEAGHSTGTWVYVPDPRPLTDDDYII